MDYQRQRSRSQTRAYGGEPSPREADYFGGGFGERTQRSKSLDYRREGAGGWNDEEEIFDRDRFRGSQPQLSRGQPRGYDYDRDLRLDFDTQRRDFENAPRASNFARSRELARSQEWYPSAQASRWQPPSPNQLRQKWRPSSQGRGEFATGSRQPGLSPKSISSGKQHNLNVSTHSRREGGSNLFGFGRRKEEHSPRSGVYPPAGGMTPRDGYRDGRYRYNDQTIEMPTMGGGGGYSRSYQSGYQQQHHSSSGHGGGGFASSFGGRKPISAQPIPGDSMVGGPYKGPPGPRHYRVNCLCFTFTWPPWSYEPAAPPQQIYRHA